MKKKLTAAEKRRKRLDAAKRYTYTLLDFLEKQHPKTDNTKKETK
jgi:hypothetical protein